MYDDILKKIIEAKEQRRKELAKLPIEDKIKILVEMQKMAKKINKNIKHEPWKI